jgi:flavin-dependent dehydrogenase
MKYDVAIIGGGPAGTTCGGLLKKYNPNLRVAIFERERFPRDHIGESQLPMICGVLDELGVWDKVEAADFPIKVGATYRWGNSDDLWDFNFLPDGDLAEEPRPAKFEGQRKQTAFQVDRSIYDKILLDHARELGVEVFEETQVREIDRNGDFVNGFVLAGGQRVEARYYVDASGNSALLRRAMGVEVDEPSNLRNIATWDYWQNAEWAVNIGVGGTRIQVMSLGYGWIWFIPLGPTRTSIGFVCPAEFYKESGLKPEQLLLKAIDDEPRIRELTKKGTREGKLSTTKDWSFIAKRMAGENWLITGEAAGFADPILSAGMSLAHSSGREAAYSILEADRGASKAWLFNQFEQSNKRKILQHIRFADYWYTANAHFSDLKEYTTLIAKDAGLELDAEAAFQWLGTGGFVETDMTVGGIALFNLGGIALIAKNLSAKPAEAKIDGKSLFVLNLRDAEPVEFAYYDRGYVLRIPGFRRDGKTLPMMGTFAWVVEALRHSPQLDIAATYIRDEMAKQGQTYDNKFHANLIDTLEAMARDGWVKPKAYAGGTAINVSFADDNAYIRKNSDTQKAST